METSCTVKIIDGLYLGDESTARVLLSLHVGLRFCALESRWICNQHDWSTSTQLLSAL